MIVVRSLAQLGTLENSVVTIGTFDGIHRGHQKIFSEVITRAKLRNGKSVFITFEPHPKEVVKKTTVPLLTTLNERMYLLRQWSPDIVFIVDFTYEFSRLSPREFYEQYIVNGFHAAEVVEGADHMFGKDRAAGIAEIKTLGNEFHFDVCVVPQIDWNGESISSSRIRSLIEQGDVEKANHLLGRLYAISGEVVRGDGRGKTLGYPTANIQTDSEKKILPALGIYVVQVSVHGKEFQGMLSIGTRPTYYTNGKRTIEVHLFSADEDLYGSAMTIRFLTRLRDEEKYATEQELIHRLHQDKEESLHYLQTIHS